MYSPAEGVKIAATDEEAKADSQAQGQDTSGEVDIDVKCNQMLRYIYGGFICNTNKCTVRYRLKEYVLH